MCSENHGNTTDAGCIERTGHAASLERQDGSAQIPRNDCDRKLHRACSAGVKGQGSAASVESVCHPRQEILRGSAGVEGIYRSLLTVIYVEDRYQLCDLEQVSHTLSKVGELD